MIIFIVRYFMILRTFNQANYHNLVQCIWMEENMRCITPWITSLERVFLTAIFQLLYHTCSFSISLLREGVGNLLVKHRLPCFIFAHWNCSRIYIKANCFISHKIKSIKCWNSRVQIRIWTSNKTRWSSAMPDSVQD